MTVSGDALAPCSIVVETMLKESAGAKHHVCRATQHQGDVPHALAQLLCQRLVLHIIAEELSVGNESIPLRR